MCSPSSQDAAVSPTIGTILLVALTVVLVAVVAVVALGLANGMFDTKQVGLTLEPYGIASESERGVSLTVHGGADAGDLIALSASLNGRELVVRDTEEPSVNNPIVGRDYLLKVVETREEKTSYRKGSGSVTLRTTQIKPVSPEGFYVVVTGKFRDGTDQVLLVKNVALPAIPEKGSFTDSQGNIQVLPADITDGYPSHGFTLSSLIPGLDLDFESVKLKVGDKTLSVSNRGLTPGRTGPNNNDPYDGSFDLNTAGISGMGIDVNTPFPTNAAMGELTGTVTVSDKKTGTEYTIDNVKIPPRVNVFENTEKISGTISVNSDQKLYTTVKITSGSGLTDETNMRYYSLKGDETHTPITSISDKSDTDIVEAYARVKIGNTNVWYKVAETSVKDLRSKSNP